MNVSEKLQLVTGGLKTSVKLTPATESSGIKTIALSKVDTKSPAFDSSKFRDSSTIAPNKFKRFDCPVESCNRNYERRQNLDVHMKNVHNLPAEPETVTLSYNPNFKDQAMKEMKKITSGDGEDLDEGEFFSSIF